MDALSDDAVVVRGGSDRDSNNVRLKIEDAILDGDGPVLSAYCMNPAQSLSATIKTLCREGDIPHAKVQVARAGALRDQGFELTQWTRDGEPACHYHVDFGHNVDVQRIELFIRASTSRYLTPQVGGGDDDEDAGRLQLTRT